MVQPQWAMGQHLCKETDLPKFPLCIRSGKDGGVVVGRVVVPGESTGSPIVYFDEVSKKRGNRRQARPGMLEVHVEWRSQLLELEQVATTFHE